MEGWFFIIGIGTFITALIFFLANARRKQSRKVRQIRVLDEMDEKGLGDGVAANREGLSARYVFAHQLLRELVKDDQFWEAFARSVENGSGAADHLLWKMWRDVGGTDEPRPSAKPIESGVLVCMPPPAEMTDCYFVAIFPHDGKRIYFTVEKSISFDATKPSLPVFCEWTDSSHVNFGESPESEVGFVALAQERFRGRTAS